MAEPGKLRGELGTLDEAASLLRARADMVLAAYRFLCEIGYEGSIPHLGELTDEKIGQICGSLHGAEKEKYPDAAQLTEDLVELVWILAHPNRKRRYALAHAQFDRLHKLLLHEPDEGHDLVRAAET